MNKRDIPTRCYNCRVSHNNLHRTIKYVKGSARVCSLLCQDCIGHLRNAGPKMVTRENNT